MKIADGELRESINNCHKVSLEDRPTGSEELNSEPIGARGFVRRHVRNGKQDLIFRERQPEVVQVLNVGINSLPVEVNGASSRCVGDSREVVMDVLLLLSVRGDPPIIALEALN